MQEILCQTLCALELHYKPVVLPARFSTCSSFCGFVLSLVCALQPTPSEQTSLFGHPKWSAVLGRGSAHQDDPRLPGLGHQWVRDLSLGRDSPRGRRSPVREARALWLLGEEMPRRTRPDEAKTQRERADPRTEEL